MTRFIFFVLIYYDIFTPIFIYLFNRYSKIFLLISLIIYFFSYFIR